ncbi:MAG: alkaline phosphatase [Candidatus Methylacidiphilales bacterium]
MPEFDPPFMSQGFSRRSALRRLGAAASGAVLLPVSALLPGTALGQTTTGGSSTPSRPKNIIFMVSDGMSLGVPVLAEQFSQMVRRTGTQWHQLIRQPATTGQGFFDMSSLNSLVTDSAAASTSWGGGSRVLNGAINSLPDGTAMAPILRLAKDCGVRTGLVTTATVTHATPAGFGASVTRRGDEPDIAPQYKGVVDVIMGGGRPFFEAGTRVDKRDVTGEFRTDGYSVLHSRSDLLAARGQSKMLGLFYGSHMPYTIDHRNDPKLLESVPTLAEMTEHALHALKNAPQGFLLQVEGARIDHAGHANDAGSILWEQLAFDDAVGVALAFAMEYPDTLVVITSDHGNSNPGLNGTGGSYAKSNDCFRALGLAKASYDKMGKSIVKELVTAMAKSGKPALKPEVTAENAKLIQQCVLGGLGLELVPEDGLAILRALSGEKVECRAGQKANMAGLMGDIMSNYNGIGWTGTSHTSDYTTILTVGPGREALYGLHQNTDAFALMAEVFGITHRNPTAPIVNPVVTPATGDNSPARRIDSVATENGRPVGHPEFLAHLEERSVTTSARARPKADASQEVIPNWLEEAHSAFAAIEQLGTSVALEPA